MGADLELDTSLENEYVNDIFVCDQDVNVTGGGEGGKQVEQIQRICLSTCDMRVFFPM
jgi:hypothetical protein